MAANVTDVTNTPLHSNVWGVIGITYPIYAKTSTIRYNRKRNGEASRRHRITKYGNYGRKTTRMEGEDSTGNKVIRALFAGLIIGRK